MEYRDFVPCPIVNEQIEAIDCIVTSDAVDGMAPECIVPTRFTSQQGWKDICKTCPYYNKA